MRVCDCVCFFFLHQIYSFVFFFFFFFLFFFLPSNRTQTRKRVHGSARGEAWAERAPPDRLTGSLCGRDTGTESNVRALPACANTVLETLAPPQSWLGPIRLRFRRCLLRLLLLLLLQFPISSKSSLTNSHVNTTVHGGSIPLNM